MAYNWLIMSQKVRQDETEIKYTLGHEVTLDLDWRAQVEPVDTSFRMHSVREDHGEPICTVIHVFYKTTFDVHVTLVLRED